MKENKNLIYTIAIIALVLILGLLWYLMINNNAPSGMNGPGGMNNNTKASYSAVKEIKENENLTSDELTESEKLARDMSVINMDYCTIIK